jgi:hypothetical protein
VVLVRPCFLQPGMSRDLVRWKPGRRFHAAGEVEERYLCRRLPNPALLPTGCLERCNITVLDQSREVRQFGSVGQQRSSLCVEIVERPLGCELRAQMLVPGEAAHGRRMQPESRSAADLAIDYRGYHLALESGQR